MLDATPYKYVSWPAADGYCSFSCHTLSMQIRCHRCSQYAADYLTSTYDKLHNSKTERLLCPAHPLAALAIWISFKLLIESLLFEHSYDVCICAILLVSSAGCQQISWLTVLCSSVFTSTVPQTLLFFLGILWPPAAHFLGLTDTLLSAHALVPSYLTLFFHYLLCATQPVRSCHLLKSTISSPGADHSTADVWVCCHDLHPQFLKPHAFLVMSEAALVLNNMQYFLVYRC